MALPGAGLALTPAPPEAGGRRRGTFGRRQRQQLSAWQIQFYIKASHLLQPVRRATAAAKCIYPSHYLNEWNHPPAECMVKTLIVLHLSTATAATGTSKDQGSCNSYFRSEMYARKREYVAVHESTF